MDALGAAGWLDEFGPENLDSRSLEVLRGVVSADIAGVERLGLEREFRADMARWRGAAARIDRELQGRNHGEGHAA